MTKLFLSHSTTDDAFVRKLHRALAGFGVMTWIESCDLRDGERLFPLTQKAIEAATAFAVVVSPRAGQSRRVGKELEHAFTVQKARGQGRYPVIPILLDGAQPSLLHGFDQSSNYSKCVSVPGDAGGVDTAVDEILAAIGLRAPAGPPSSGQPKPESLEDLTMQVIELEIDDDDGAPGAWARALLAELTAEMEKHFPAGRDEPVDSSVEPSLRRLSPSSQSKADVLSMFHGGVSLAVLHGMMKWSLQELDELARELVAAGLAKRNPYKHLSLRPALGPYLRARMSPAEREALEVRWAEGMREYVELLVQMQGQHAEVAAKLTLLDLPNLFALLAFVQATGDAGATLRLAESLYRLLEPHDKPRLLECVAQARDSAAQTLTMGELPRPSQQAHTASSF